MVLESGQADGMFDAYYQLNVFGPFPKVEHPLHEKSAKDGTLCKRDKKRTGNLSVSGFLWSR